MNAAAHPLRFRRLLTAEVCTQRVPVADTLLSRLLGLSMLSSERAGEGLLIPGCRSVHTFGMRFAIDLIFLDRRRRPVAVYPAVGRNRIVGEPRAVSVLELPAKPASGRA